jgi:hypothetical protein
VIFFALPPISSPTSAKPRAQLSSMQSYPDDILHLIIAELCDFVGVDTNIHIQYKDLYGSDEYCLYSLFE